MGLLRMTRKMLKQHIPVLWHNQMVLHHAATTTTGTDIEAFGMWANEHGKGYQHMVDSSSLKHLLTFILLDLRMLNLQTRTAVDFTVVQAIPRAPLLSILAYND